MAYDTPRIDCLFSSFEVLQTRGWTGYCNIYLHTKKTDFSADIVNQLIGIDLELGADINKIMYSSAIEFKSINNGKLIDEFQEKCQTPHNKASKIIRHETGMEVEFSSFEELQTTGATGS